MLILQTECPFNDSFLCFKKSDLNKWATLYATPNDDDYSLFQIEVLFCNMGNETQDQLNGICGDSFNFNMEIYMQNYQ